MTSRCSKMLSQPLSDPSTSRDSKLSRSAVESSKGKEKPSGSDDDCRRSKRFRSKVLNFWDFEKICVVETEEGTKAAVIKDIPGEGSILLNQNSTDEEEMFSLIIPKKNRSSSIKTKSAKANSQHKSANKSVVFEASHNKTHIISEQPSFIKLTHIETSKSNEHPNVGQKLSTKSHSNNASVIKQSGHKKPTKNRLTSHTGTAARKTRRHQALISNGHQCDDLVPSAELAANSQASKNNEPNTHQLEEQSVSNVSTTGRSGKKVPDKCSSTESLNSSTSEALSVGALQAIPKHTININLRSLKLPHSKETPEVFAEGKPQKRQCVSKLPSDGIESRCEESGHLQMETDTEDAPMEQVHSSGKAEAHVSHKVTRISPAAVSDRPSHTLSDARGSQASLENLDEPVNVAGGGSVRSGDVFIKGSDLIFHGLFHSPPTGEYSFAKGGAHGNVETFFLHLKKGFIVFSAPKDMNVFVVRGCGHCSQVVPAAPSLVCMLFKGTKVNVEKNVMLRVGVNEDCNELILSLLLYDAEPLPGRP